MEASIGYSSLESEKYPIDECTKLREHHLFLCENINSIVVIF